ncbi:MAG: hypothetical protein ACYDCI_00285 [Candidatus Limnocylindrales bacterium]
MERHCQHCPVGDGEYCRGEHVTRFCRLVDPTSPAHDAAYVPVVVEQSAVWAARASSPAIAHPTVMEAADVAGRAAAANLIETIRPASPSLAARAASAAAAAGRAAAAAARRRPVFVDAPTLGARATTCQSCERFVPATGRCGLCGCFLALKLRLATEQCPDNPPRWAALASEIPT